MTNWCWYVSTSDTFNRGIQIIKCLALDYLCTDFAADSESREASFSDNQSVDVLIQKITKMRVLLTGWSS